MVEKNYYEYGNIQLGRGDFSLPPVLIGTLFYQGETLVERKNPEIFDAAKAKKRIETQQALSEKYKIPSMVEISGITPEAMVKYLDFYLDNFQPPFVLGGTFDARVAGIEYLEERGVKPDEYVYNAISNLKNKKELDLLREHEIKSAVILILASENMTCTQRYGYITKKNEPQNVNLIDGIKDTGVEEIWVDGGVITLESLAHILETQQLISTSLQLPVGTAPTLFLFKYSSPRLNEKFHTKFRKASIMFIASWFSNFVFYGAIEDAKECFASTYQSTEFKKIYKSRGLKLNL
jgi:tetrahydromethanopterin S-methyltransferase subunit H